MEYQKQILDFMLSCEAHNVELAYQLRETCNVNVEIVPELFFSEYKDSCYTVRFLSLKIAKITKLLRSITKDTEFNHWNHKWIRCLETFQEKGVFNRIKMYRWDKLISSGSFELFDPNFEGNWARVERIVVKNITKSKAECVVSGVKLSKSGMKLVAYSRNYKRRDLAGLFTQATALI